MLQSPKKNEGLIASSCFVYAGLIVLVSIVTAATRASALPSSSAPVVRVIDAYAIIVPLTTLLVPSVAELPTAQKTFEARAPFANTMLAPDAVVSVEAIWKMKTALASPCASSVKVPVIASDEVDL
jgi:hypothetical protein